MKVKVIKDCYYNLEFIKAGRIIEFKGKKLPSWATLADGIETRKPAAAQGENKIEEKEAVPVNPDENPEEQEKAGENAAETSAVENEQQVAPASAQELEYLDKLINEGIEKGILIEDSDKKTVKEQIAELETVLKK